MSPLFSCFVPNISTKAIFKTIVERLAMLSEVIFYYV